MMTDIKKKFEEKYTDDFLKTCGFKSEFDEYWDNPMLQEEYQKFRRGYESRQSEIDKLWKALEEIIDLASEYERPIPNTIKVDEIGKIARQVLEDKA